ncbi:hypothetical protein JTE90_018088 [Oedothorax gibbosus]|uniref:Uncharacterized protein n=1 Tax=Oedothorax gibbosus TaxID=931172 RepID=A0AAV6UEY2_9ARAC|nr:hypothetical protein JTE90_018088 [Oedothorax gibbosus]
MVQGVGRLLKEHDNFDILKHPSRVLNGDETSFSMCPKTGKVIAPKGWENVYQLQQGNDKETITDTSDNHDDEIKKKRECCTVCDIVLESDEEEYD